MLKKVKKKVIQLNKINTDIKNFILQLKKNKIKPERSKRLDQIAKNIIKNNYPSILFVCTHNSRRSQFAEIWGNTINFIYNKKIKIISAGTKKKAFNDRAINTIKEIGFDVKKIKNKCHIKFSENYKSIVMFSKTINEIDNNTPLISIMTCSDADKNCPVVPNALNRFLLSYEDPRLSDNSKIEKTKYLEACKTIGTEILYLFSKIN